MFEEKKEEAERLARPELGPGSVSGGAAALGSEVDHAGREDRGRRWVARHAAGVGLARLGFGRTPPPLTPCATAKLRYGVLSGPGRERQARDHRIRLRRGRWWRWRRSSSNTVLSETSSRQPGLRGGIWPAVGRFGLCARSSDTPLSVPQSGVGVVCVRGRPGADPGPTRGLVIWGRLGVDRWSFRGRRGGDERAVVDPGVNLGNPRGMSSGPSLLKVAWRAAEGGPQSGGVVGRKSAQKLALLG